MSICHGPAIDAKIQSLGPSTKLNLGNRVMGEVEKNRFIALSGKAECRGLKCSKLCVPTQRSWGRCNNGSRVGLLIRLGCAQGLHSFNLASGSFLWFLWLPNHDLSVE